MDGILVIAGEDVRRGWDCSNGSFGAERYLYCAAMLLRVAPGRHRKEPKRQVRPYVHCLELHRDDMKTCSITKYGCPGWLRKHRVTPREACFRP